MITEKEFEKYCKSVTACGKNKCNFYIECRIIKDQGILNYSEFYSMLYKELVKVWRKEKLAKLLS